MTEYLNLQKMAHPTVHFRNWSELWRTLFKDYKGSRVQEEPLTPHTSRSYPILGSNVHPWLWAAGGAQVNNPDPVFIMTDYPIYKTSISITNHRSLLTWEIAYSRQCTDSLLREYNLHNAQCIVRCVTMQSSKHCMKSAQPLKIKWFSLHLQYQSILFSWLALFNASF